MDKVNQWGYLTQFEVRHNLIDARSTMDFQPDYISGGISEIRFEGLAPATPQILATLEHWMRGNSPFYASEWICLYCASPNPIPTTHCLKCGAPRNWLIG